MHAAHILGQDAFVAGAAGRRNVRAIHAAGRIALRPDVVAAMAALAVGGHEQAALAHRAAVDAVLVERRHVADRNVALLDDRRIAVAAAAGRRQIERIRRRRRVLGAPNLVGRMAIDARGGDAVRGLAPREGVNALVVVGDRGFMARGAVHAGQFRRVRELLGGLQIRVAVDTGESHRAVDRPAELLGHRPPRTCRSIRRVTHRHGTPGTVRSREVWRRVARCVEPALESPVTGGQP